uniref:UPF0754 membrane protein Cyan7425_4067 n=1 Tax=Cyanothece sp. (strain PCC 7425 / ATCC 29141) TaxID=395961 RepID=Y4067_CYAP4|nr:RecName: Full=UPF0754 membrane protein Cyan7425_4067 [Cyanothece sp. PCC 7425]
MALSVPPIAGAIIGYFTNDLAITMLFRPYKPIKIGQRTLPFTPGLIPANQERLARRISDAIMGSLLTPEELQKLTRRLLQTERVQAAIQWLLKMALDQVQSETEQKSAQVLAHILHDLLGSAIPRLIRVWARREDFLEAQLNQIFDQVLLELKLSEEQAGRIADWLLQVVLPPDRLRQTLIDFLTDRNIQVIDEDLREKTSGTYWVVANLFGVRNTLIRLRDFCIEEREACNVRLAELMDALGVRQRLIEGLQDLSLQNLPVATVRQLRKVFRQNVRIYIQSQGLELVKGLSDSLNWEHVSLSILNRLRSSTAVTASLEVVSQELALVLERYLERDLEIIVEKAIPILNLDEVIVERVKATTPQELEAAIQGIVKSELQAIVTLGGVLGLLIGIAQSVLLLVQGGL